MDILSVFVIAVGLAMDSFAVCIGKGMCRRRFLPWRSFKIALVFGLFQGVMPLIGFGLGIGFAAWIEQLDHWLALIILVFIGLKMIYESLLPKKDDECVDGNCLESSAIDWKLVTSLAFATSIDALATGLIFVPYRQLIGKAVLIIGAVSLVFTFAGMFIGVRFGRKIRVNVELIGGIILIAIGVKIFLEHTVL